MSSGNIDLTGAEVLFLYEVVKDIRKEGQNVLAETDINDPERNDILDAQAKINSLYRKLKTAVSSMHDD